MDEITLLREIADAACNLDLYEDLRSPLQCSHCYPPEPAEVEAIRLRLYEALNAYRAWEREHLAASNR